MSNESIINELKVAYAMELETVQNYIACSVNLDGVRSDVIKKALAADIAEGTARQGVRVRVHILMEKVRQRPSRRRAAAARRRAPPPALR